MPTFNAFEGRNLALTNLSYQFISRILPEVVIHSTRKRGLLLNRPAFTLSFDCETEFDSMVVESIHEKLQRLGINPMYAVPGEVLLKAVPTYRKIKSSGAVFINHGFVQHTKYDSSKGKYSDQYFYSGRPIEEIYHDILKGHEVLSSVLEFQPRIFRTPHFGTFQQPRQLQWLWKNLQQHDYLVSSSTGPHFAYRNGAISRQGEIYEVSVSPNFFKPWRTLDSWGYFAGNEISLPPSDFIDALDGYLSAMNNGANFYVNIYADPLHVSNWPEFFIAISRFAKFQVKDFVEVIAISDS